MVQIGDGKDEISLLFSQCFQELSGDLTLRTYHCLQFSFLSGHLVGESIDACQFRLQRSLFCLVSNSITWTFSFWIWLNGPLSSVFPMLFVPRLMFYSAEQCPSIASWVPMKPYRIFISHWRWHDRLAFLEEHICIDDFTGFVGLVWTSPAMITITAIEELARWQLTIATMLKKLKRKFS